jgi:hypothetical protein
VLVLNGKGWARGTAEVLIVKASGDKQQEIAFMLMVCADAPASTENRCKLLPDDNPATRVGSFEYGVEADVEVRSWHVILSLDTDDEGELKPCSASGTTLPAHVTCGPTPTRQSVVFQLTGGGQ